MSKFLSGRFIWCLSSALVFIVLSIKQVLPIDKIVDIIIIIVMAYFGRTDRNKDNVGKS